jgi:hypothetical protein
MEVAMAYERAQGWEPEDVSAQDRGFDVLSRHPATGGTRFIEVKGRAEEGSIVLTLNEHSTAQRLGQDYWLYVVFHCASEPQLIRISDPAQMDWQSVMKIEHYTIGARAMRNNEWETVARQKKRPSHPGDRFSPFTSAEAGGHDADGREAHLLT